MNISNQQPMAFDLMQFREQFPALNNTEVYLDSASTALTCMPAIKAMQSYYTRSGGNVHRSTFSTSLEMTQDYEDARSRVANWLNAADPHEIVWTSGTTESINLVAQAWLRPRLQPNDEILVSEMEHHANLIPWLMVAEQTGAKVVKWPIGKNLSPNKRLFTQLLNKKTRLVAVTQMSNVTGACPDLSFIIQLAHKTGAKVMVDGAQGIVQKHQNIQALNADFYAFSGHKIYASTGTGVLYGKAERLSEMSAWKGGGKMLIHADFSGFTPQFPPWCFEAGTPNVAGVIGLSETLKWLETIDFNAAKQWSINLADHAEEKLKKINNIRVFRAPGSSLLSFDIKDCHFTDLATLLSQQGIAIRAGQLCAQPLMQAMGVTGVLRASFAPYNRLEEVEIFTNAVEKSVTFLRSLS